MNKASIPNFSDLGSPEVAVYLLSRVGWVGGGGWVVITRFKAKSQFKLDFTGTELELSLAKMTIQALGNRDFPYR